MALTLDSKTIDTLRDIPDLIPVYREYYFKVYKIGTLKSCIKIASRFSTLKI